jgi:hypothetical protein
MTDYKKIKAELMAIQQKRRLTVEEAFMLGRIEAYLM